MDFKPSDRIRSRLVTSVDHVVSPRSSPIPVFVAVKRRTGKRDFPRCVFRGFFEPEIARDRRQIWSSDHAEIECLFPTPTKIQFVWLEIAHTGPRGATLDLSVNDQPLLTKKRIRRQRTVCVKLPTARVFSNLTISLQTSTFVPSMNSAMSDDSRNLGVCISAVVFGKRRTKYRAGSFEAPAINERLANAMRQWWPRRAA